MLGGAVDCAGCREGYEVLGDEPPCSTCLRPDLLRENETAWRIWQLLAGFNRPVVAGMAGAQRLQIKATDALKVCEAYGTTLEDFERVMVIEDAAYPLLQEKWESAAPDAQDSEQE